MNPPGGGGGGNSGGLVDDIDLKEVATKSMEIEAIDKVLLLRR